MLQASWYGALDFLYGDLDSFYDDLDSLYGTLDFLYSGIVLWTFCTVFWIRTFRCDVSSHGTLVAVITLMNFVLSREKQFEIRPKIDRVLSG